MLPPVVSTTRYARLWSADPFCSLWPAVVADAYLDVGQNRGQHGLDALRHHFLMLPLRHGCSSGRAAAPKALPPTLWVNAVGCAAAPATCHCSCLQARQAVLNSILGCRIAAGTKLVGVSA
jgi:hypothetical protein